MKIAVLPLLESCPVGSLPATLCDAAGTPLRAVSVDVRIAGPGKMKPTTGEMYGADQEDFRRLREGKPCVLDIIGFGRIEVLFTRPEGDDCLSFVGTGREIGG